MLNNSYIAIVRTAIFKKLAADLHRSTTSWDGRETDNVTEIDRCRTVWLGSHLRSTNIHVPMGIHRHGKEGAPGSENVMELFLSVGNTYQIKYYA